MRPRFIALAAAAVALALAAPPLALAADPAPHVYAANVDYAQGTLGVGAHYDAGTATVRLFAADGATVLGQIACPPTRSKVHFPPFALRSVRSFVVRGYNADGSWRWGRRLSLDPVDFRPLRPTLTVASGKVVGAKLSFAGDAYRQARKVRVYHLEADRSSVATLPVTALGHFSFSGLPMTFGENNLTVGASNGFGAGPKRAVRVFNLGSELPTSSRYVFISKRILWLFHVRYGRVVNRWPVAIGTPQTPTPTGTFYIGDRMAAPNAVWGPFRRPLLKKHDGVYYRTRYYVHGTNEPWSIGMMASHGCVRMYNSDLREFERVVPDYTRVKIR